MSGSLSAWTIQQEDFPESGSLAEQIRFVLGYAILAPSSHNAQPWRFAIEKDRCTIFVDPNLSLPESDPDARFAHMGVGACLELFVQAATVFQMNPVVEEGVEDSVYKAVVQVESGTIPSSPSPTLSAITRRVNMRGPFLKDQPAGAFMSDVRAINRFDDVTLHLLEKKEDIAQTAKLTARGLRMAHAQAPFRKELAKWINHNRSTKKTGIPGYTMNAPTLISYLLAPLIGRFNLSGPLGKLNEMSIASAPLACVISSPSPGKQSWVHAGQVAAAAMIRGMQDDFYSSVYVASTVFPELSDQLKTILSTDQAPQLFFCMGRVKKPFVHSPRRSVADSMID